MPGSRARAPKPHAFTAPAAAHRSADHSPARHAPGEPAAAHRSASPLHQLAGVPALRATPDAVVQAVGWESFGPLNPRRYLPTWLGGYTQPQMAENGLRPDANERMARWQQRGQTRKQRNPMPTGEYDTASGPISVSGGPGGRQRMIQTNRQNYGDQTLGSLPAYADVRNNLADADVAHLVDGSPHPHGTDMERLSLSVGIGLTHVAEEHRSPGSGKFMRALARRRASEPTSPHPFDAAVNPGVEAGGPQKLRDLMSGTRPVTPDQRAAVDGYASDSSDDADDYEPLRTGKLRRRPARR